MIEEGNPDPSKYRQRRAQHRPPRRGLLANTGKRNVHNPTTLRQLPNEDPRQPHTIARSKWNGEMSIRRNKTSQAMPHKHSMTTKMSIEKRRRHQLDIDPKLLRWLGRDPTRFPKAREDMARWTRYMATEMSNPAFPLFLSMAGSMARNPARAPHQATTPLTSKRK